MPDVHAVLSASAAKRWMNCPPSARLGDKLKERFGDGETEFAREGTKAHAVAELKLRRENGEINDYLFKTRLEALGEVPAEMRSATDYYVDTVMQKLYEARKVSEDAVLMVEQRLDYSAYAPHGFGTGDAIVVSDRTLDVCDLKYGRGVPVVAEDNPQIRLYAVGAVELLGDLYGFDRVTGTIIQPRLESVTSETLGRGELLRWAEEAVKPVAALAWEGKGEFKSGEWCRFCPARAICWQRMSDVMKAFTEQGFAGVIPESEIPGILGIADTAESWIKDIREYAKNQMLKGVVYPGFKLVHGKRANKTWLDEARVREELDKAGIAPEQYTRTELLTPVNMEKLLGSSTYRALLGQFVKQAEGAPTLATEDDKRRAFGTAEMDFSDLKGD